MNYEVLLKSLSRHVAVGEKDFELFCNLSIRRNFRRRQYVDQRDTLTRSMHFVNKGCLRAFYTDNVGKEHNIAFAVEGWWIGDFAAFLTGSPAVLDVECLENCEILEWDHNALERLYAEAPIFERYFRLVAQFAYVATRQRLISVLSMSAYERYLEFLERYPQFVERIPNHHIASYLGIMPESLSRLRKEAKCKTKQAILNTDQ